jgi:hypothetical protein
MLDTESGSDDDTSEDGTASMAPSYFDPPINDFNFNYYDRQK